MGKECKETLLREAKCTQLQKKKWKFIENKKYVEVGGEIRQQHVKA